MNFQLKECGEKGFVGNDDDDDDRISQLPDDILLDILSLVSLKEAARTSVLSSRWINLWKHTPSLDFDTDESLFEKFYYDGGLLQSEKRKYMKWVNSVIRSHESLALKEFKIRFPLLKPARKAITRWLKFAFSRHVQRLELDTSKSYCDPSAHYCLPDELLTLNRSCQSIVGFKSLKALVFKSVFVSDGAIAFLLHNCPLLEQLIVHDSQKTSKLEVCGSALKLKHLELVNCWALESIKVVSLPRLTTLALSSLKGLLLENLPVLVNLSVQCNHDSISIKHLFNVVLSCWNCQLQTLCLRLNGFMRAGMDDELCELPQMPKLKKLEIEYDARGDESFVRLAALVRISPYLEEFVLRVDWSSLPRIDREEKAAIIRSPHRHLKVFKFCGYYGSTNDLELLSYVLENRVVLEKIIIGTYCSYFPEVEQSARETALQKLPPQVPQPVELLIL